MSCFLKDTIGEPVELPGCRSLIGKAAKMT